MGSKTYVELDASHVVGMVDNFEKFVLASWEKHKAESIVKMRKHWFKRWWYRWTTDDGYIEGQLEYGGFTTLMLAEAFQVEPKLEMCSTLRKACNLAVSAGNGKIQMTLTDVANLSASVLGYSQG